MKTKSVLLIGLGRFGKNVALNLNQLGHEIMAVDKDESCVNEVMPIVTDAQIGDSTKEVFLKSLGVNNYDVCIVAISGNFQSSLETTCLLKELGAKKVVARAESDIHEKFLLKNGADEVVYPEKQLASWVAIRNTSDHLLDYIEIDESCSIYEVKVPKAWFGKTILEVDIRKKYNVNIVAIRENGKINFAVTPDLLLESTKSLLVLGDYKTIKKCFDL